MQLDLMAVMSEGTEGGDISNGCLLSIKNTLNNAVKLILKASAMANPHLTRRKSAAGGIIFDNDCLG